MVGRFVAPQLKTPKNKARAMSKIGTSLRRALMGRIDMHKPLVMKNMPNENGFERPPKRAELNASIMYK